MRGAETIQSVLSIPAKIRIIAGRKRRLRHALRDCHAFIQDGLWSLSEPLIARHLSVRTLPKSLASTKTVDRTRFGWINRRLRKILNFLVPPYVARIAPRAADEVLPPLCGNYAFLILTKSGDKILIDRECTEVLRILAHGPKGDDWAATRERLARHVSLPDITILQDGQLARESFADGCAFVALDVAARAAVADRLVGQYELLTTQDAEPPNDSFWREALATVKLLDLPADARREIERFDAGYLRQIQSLPFTPAHGDLSSSNIIVSEDGATLIDLEDCEVLPAFFDLFFLAHQEYLCGRTDIWRDVIDGTHGQRIDRVLERAGVGGETNSRLIWIRAMFLTECFIWPRKKGGQPLNRQRLTEWWAPIAATLNDPPRVQASQQS